MNFEFPFNAAETTFIAGYILSLIVIGWLGMRAQKEKSMKDFYLGGSGIGFMVLLLTLYATQYSGNTLFGFTGKAYKVGFQWLVCVHFMTAIVVFYTLFAPQLYALARRHTFITPSDFLTLRFGSRAMSVFASILMILGLANYLLAQLKALGEASRGFLPPEHATTAYISGVIALALIIVVYETLGGFRAVAWTDVIQGLVLMFGFAIVVYLVFEQFGGLGAAIDRLAASPDDRAKVIPPQGKQIAEWISWVFIVGLGGALYPQAIQRIYAAKSAPALRRSLAVMAFLPLTTTLIAVLFGVVASAQENLEVGSTDAVLTTVCKLVQEQSAAARWLVVVLFAGVLAALMSTADSVLLSISSMFTKDIYSVARPQSSQAELTFVGKCCSWLVIALMSVAAILLRDIDLVTILKIKFELLVQLAPAFILGVNWRRMNANWTFVGMFAGVAVALAITALGAYYGWGGKIYGVHAGLYGLAVNSIIAVLGSLSSPAEPWKEPEVKPEPK